MSKQRALALSLAGSLVGLSAPALADWVTMHPYEYGQTLYEQTSFKPQPDEAAMQLSLMGYPDAQARELEVQLTLYLDDDPLTLSTCSDAVSEDSTIFSELGVNRANELPSIVTNQTQRLGADLPVVSCLIRGIATPVVWFYSRSGYYQSTAVEGPCNNIGVVLPPPVVTKRQAPSPTPRTAPTPPTRTATPPPPPAPTTQGQHGDWGVMNVPPRVVHVPDLRDNCGCLIAPSVTTIIPGSNLQPADWN